ncbi:CoA ester lyase [Halomonas sp. QX-2]|uniref:CoA ester lyase n=1 Tax=Vreelandella sedimenti TaxID=2729618 RepID=A0A7Z0SQ46_9GAMM|nr:CoA ester lyase [Halomonas sedimenti]NYT74963.1 CoA ester lyase [Halomonas sedimenti]
MRQGQQRSLLFVPGTRTDRIAKALASGADIVVVDLEDAVALEEKATARKALEQYLNSTPGVSFIVRINAEVGNEEQDFQQDLALCTKFPAITGVMLPKTETPEQIARASASGKPIWPLIETAQGLISLPKIAASTGVERLVFGALDMAVDLNLEPGSSGAETVLDHCRHQLILHSRAHSLPSPIESVTPEINDLSKVEIAAKKAVEMGFSGMLSIHPKQVLAIHNAFTPDDKTLHWARCILEEAKVRGGAFQFEGQMVDAPVLSRARAVLARANN